MCVSAPLFCWTTARAGPWFQPHRSRSALLSIFVVASKSRMCCTEEQDSAVPAHSPHRPAGTCVTVSLPPSHYEIRWAVNPAAEAMAAGAAVLVGHLGGRLDVNQSDAARAAGVKPCLAPPDVGYPRDPWGGEQWGYNTKMLLETLPSPTQWGFLVICVLLNTVPNVERCGHREARVSGGSEAFWIPCVSRRGGSSKPR